MQQLHLVGFTTELDGLIFSARKGSKSGGYVVPLDDRFVALIREALERQGSDSPLADGDGSALPVRRGRPVRVPDHESLLSPKEIQARLRAGRTVSDVAAEAGVDEDWILRLAAPVIAEQTRIIERALAMPCRAPRKGESAQPLGIAVGWNLADRGLRLTSDELARGWGAYHLREAVWVLHFQYRSRGREQVAQWELDLSTGSLISLNRLGSELGYVEPGRRRRRPSTIEFVAVEHAVLRPAPERVITPEVVEEEQPAGRASRRRRGRRPSTRRRAKARASSTPRPTTAAAAKKAPLRRVAKKTPAKKTPAKKTPAKKTPAKKTPAKKTPAKKTPAKATRPAKSTRRAKAPARKAAATKGPVRKAVARKATAKRAGATNAAAKKRAVTKTAAKKVPVTPAATSTRPIIARPRPAFRASVVTPAAVRTLLAPSASLTPEPPTQLLAGPAAEAAPEHTHAPADPLGADLSIGDVPRRPRPLVAVRRIDTRSKAFPTATGQRVVLPSPAPIVTRDDVEGAPAPA